MPAVHRRHRKKAEKAVRSVFEKVTTALPPVWLLKSHENSIRNYFNNIKQELKDDGHVTADDDEDFLHALVGETFQEQCLSLDLPEFMEDLAYALHDHAVRMKKLLNKKNSEMRSVVYTYANKLVEYLCEKYPQYQDEIYDYFLTGLFCKYEEEYGDDYEEW
jgi:hypothetical protein